MALSPSPFTQRAHNWQISLQAHEPLVSADFCWRGNNCNRWLCQNGLCFTVHNSSRTCAIALALEKYTMAQCIDKSAKHDLYTDRIIFDFYLGLPHIFWLIPGKSKHALATYTQCLHASNWDSEDLEFWRFDMNSSSDENLQEASLVSVLYPPALTVACLAEIGGMKKGPLLLLQLLLDEEFLEGVDVCRCSGDPFPAAICCNRGSSIAACCWVRHTDSGELIIMINNDCQPWYSPLLWYWSNNIEVHHQ